MRFLEPELTNLISFICKSPVLSGTFLVYDVVKIFNNFQKQPLRGFYKYEGSRLFCGGIVWQFHRLRV
jgi:hypothetical protein